MDLCLHLECGKVIITPGALLTLQHQAALKNYSPLLQKKCIEF